MSDVCKEWYEQWKERYNKNIELWNTDKNQCCEKITGFPIDHAAWRYMKIGGAVDRMGGFANFKHYVNHCAEEDYLAHHKLEKENKKLKAIIKSEFEKSKEVKEYEKTRESIVELYVKSKEENQKLKAALEVARDAVEFYGDERNWYDDIEFGKDYDYDYFDDASIDDCKKGGKKAREAKTKIDEILNEQKIERDGQNY